MPLHLYRRHRLECEAGRPEDSRSTELDEGRKGWGRRCRCQIHVSGTLAGKYTRKSTNTTDWAEARRVVNAHHQANAWTLDIHVAVAITAPPPPAAPDTPVRVTLVEACTVFYTSREALDLSGATLGKYRTFNRQLQAFAKAKGYVMLDQLTMTDIDVFWAIWKLGQRTKAKRLTTLRGFFRFCMHRKWIRESPVSPDIKPRKDATRAANKVPFTDDQLMDIIQACDGLEDQRWGNRFGSGVWTGEDVKDFIWTLTYTGLRISDAAFFDIHRLHGNECFVRATKNGGDVFTYLPNWLCDRLQSRAQRFGRRIFLTAGSTRLETVTDTWRQRLAKVFALADVGEEPATPHRFRHTFARILLQKGVPVTDVADLLGDDEKTVRRHYARWVPERQERLTRILQDAFSDKPKLVGIRGGPT